MKKIKSLLLSLTAVLLVFIFLPSKALAQFSGQNGRILYIAQTAGDPTDPATFNSRDIYSINSDGTSPIRLTNNDLYDNWPKTSKDGKKVVWYQCNWVGVFPANVNSCEIWIMNLDNLSSATKLTDNAFADTQPSFSPDGTRIVFVSSRDNTSLPVNQTVDLYSMKLDGTDVVRLTNFGSTSDGPISGDIPANFAGTFPNYSPDASYVYFSRYIATQSGGYFNVWRVASTSTGGANTGLTAVTTGTATVPCNSSTCDLEDGHPDVSPDGKSIVIHSNRGSSAGSPEKYSVYQFNIESGLPKNTADMTVVSDNSIIAPEASGQYALWPTYSPDGTKIVYTRYPGPDTSLVRAHSYMLTVGSAAGSTPSLLTISSATTALPLPNLQEYVSSVSSYWAALPSTPPPVNPTNPVTPAAPNTSLASSKLFTNSGYTNTLIALASVLVVTTLLISIYYLKSEFRGGKFNKKGNTDS